MVDPFGGAADLKNGVLRTVRPRSFAEDPLRLVRGLRLVSQLGLEPDAETLRQMRAEASSVALVSGERVGGGLGADGMGELSKLLLGREPARALRLARDTGVLVALLPEFEQAIGFEQDSERQHLPLDEHIFAVVQAAADAGAPLAVRLGALFHDLGKPRVKRETCGTRRRARRRGDAAASLPDESAHARDSARARARLSTGPRRRALRASLPPRARRRASPSTSSRTRRPTSVARRSLRTSSRPRRGCASCSSRNASNRTGWRISRSTGRT